MQMHNVRHDLSPALVRAEIGRAVAAHESRRIRLKEQMQDTIESYEQAKVHGAAAHIQNAAVGLEYIDTVVDGWIAVERHYYALVRVIALRGDDDKRFILVYGDADDETVSDGTGPFDSVEAASQWFLTGGR